MDAPIHENLIKALNNNEPNELNRNDPYLRLCTSERLNKDVETLMNSSFWINALKSSKAIGIGSQLHFQLIESHTFMKNFIIYSINLKRNFIKLLTNQVDEEKKHITISQQQQTNHLNNLDDDLANIDGQLLRSLNNEHFSEFEQFELKVEPQFKEYLINVEIKFFVECIFLAILDLDDFIGTTSDIIAKLIYWFPELRKSCIQIKTLIGSILNTTPCFKRLMNFTKASHNNRPIILGKRQYIWSVDQLYLKPFIRHFYKRFESKKEINYKLSNYESSSKSISVIAISCTNEKPLIDSNTSSYELNTLFSSWKFKIEQFKLLMQLKHNHYGFAWSDQSLSAQNNDLLDRLDFLKLDKPPLNPRTKKINPKIFKLDDKNLIIKQKETSSIIKKKIIKAKKTEKPPRLTLINKNSCKKDQKIKQVLKPLIQSQIQPQPLNHHAIVDLNPKIIRPNDIQLIKFSEDSTINLICNNEEITTTVDPNKIVNTSHSHTQFHVQPEQLTSTSITTSNNCTYFNLLSVSYNPTAYYHQNDLNVNQMVVDNNVDASVEELLNCNENEISIEHDKFIYF